MVYSDKPGERVRIEDTPAELRNRFCINDEDVQELSKQALVIEQHYGRPMDIEWAKDGNTGKLYIVQARPETVKSRAHATQLERFHLNEKGKVLAEGRSIGQKIGAGKARVIRSLADMNKVQPGDVLIADMTDPDWEPVMKRAAAIVTNRGGRTCHAAIIARELGVPAVVGTGNGLDVIPDGAEVTVSCAEGDTGMIYEGVLKFERVTADLGDMPEAPLKIMMNVANPERAFDFGMLPNAGIGLARLEMIIASHIGVHPKALLEYAKQDAETKKKIDERMAGYADPVSVLCRSPGRRHRHHRRLGVSEAGDRAPVRLQVERVRRPDRRFALRAARRKPDDRLPRRQPLRRSRLRRFVRTGVQGGQARARSDGLGQRLGDDPVRAHARAKAARSIEVLAKNGLKQGEHDLKIIMMCEVPSNALLADEFLEIFDGFSIGSNDLTQLTLGLDRDSSIVANLFDERDPAVKKLLAMAIQTAREKGKYVGICGQGPSDHPDLAEWLMDQGIESVSLNPDTVVDTWLRLAKRKSA